MPLSQRFTKRAAKTRTLNKLAAEKFRNLNSEMHK